MKKLFFLLIFLVSGFSLRGQQSNKYCNAPFSFCVDVPVAFNRVGASKTGDGQSFSAKDGSTLAIYAVYNTDKETPKQHFDRTIAALSGDSSLANFTQLPVIEKAEMQENTYTVVYLNNGITNQIYRQFDNSIIKTIELQSATTKVKGYAGGWKKMIESLK